MIKFIFKGILRDKNRSLLPVIIISLGVFLTVFLSAWMNGVFSDIINLNANFSSGHVKITTKAYAENSGQMPNDLALLEISELMDELEQEYPEINWMPRIHFGGLLDIADENGETRAQGPAIGKAIDLFSPDSKEAERMNIPKSIVKGKIPTTSGEALVSNDFAERFDLQIGEKVTLFGSSMNGNMIFSNFTVTGTIRFGSPVLDRGAIIVDITDAQQMLEMEDAAGEILGFQASEMYNNLEAEKLKNSFNDKYLDEADEFSPIMYQLRDQNGLGEYLLIAESMSSIMIFIFIFAMSIVLWNTGLLGGLRRYTEFGVRLALGEEKGQIYRSLLYESVLVGFIGSLTGTILGLAAGYYLQENGIDFGSAIQSEGMMIPTVYRAIVSSEAYYIGFIPGVFSMILGTALSGIGIYKRQTAHLFKELEV